MYKVASVSVVKETTKCHGIHLAYFKQFSSTEIEFLWRALEFKRDQAIAPTSTTHAQHD